MQKSTNKQVDETDRAILEILLRDARVSLTEVGRRVHLTSQAVKNRLERLHDLGIVQKYTVNVNCPVYGFKLHALIKANLSAKAQEKLLQHIKERGYHILHFYQTTGTLGVLLDIYFVDDAEMQAFLAQIQPYGTYEIQMVLKDIPLEPVE